MICIIYTVYTVRMIRDALYVQYDVYSTHYAYVKLRPTKKEGCLHNNKSVAVIDDNLHESITF